VKQHEAIIGGSSEIKPPLREVPNNTHRNTAKAHTDDQTHPVYVTTNETSKADPESVLTRDKDPQNPERVDRIMKEVTIGPDIMQEQCEIVQKLLEEYANCFTLSIKEVNAIPGAVHKLNIPKDATFWMKIPPRSYNPDQRAFVNGKVNKMLEAGIVHPIHPSEVRFIVQTVLVKKTHEGQGLSIKELKYKVSEQCIKNNLPGKFDIPPQPESDTHNPSKHDTPIKWRICQDFNGINKVTEVAPVLQGDIGAKQLRLSGHQYVHVFDFAAGFYGISVHPNSQLYITFFIEGRGYFTYQHCAFLSIKSS
jgi:hypothetical protein